MAKYPGLLPVSQGDKEQAFYRGLMQMGANMGGYSDRPTSFAQQLGRGGQGFVSGYQDAIDRSKADQGLDLAAQQQRMQIEAQKMKIVRAKEEKAEADRRKLLAEQFTNLQMMGGEQGPTVAAGQNMGAVDPMTAWQMQNDPQGYMASQVATQSGIAAEQRKHGYAKELEALKAGAKPPKTVTTDKGVFVQNPDGSLGERLGGYKPSASTTVNVGGKETPTDKRMFSLFDANDAVGRKIQSLRTMRELSGKTPTGIGAEWKSWATKAADALGMDVDMSGVQSLEQFKVLQMDFVMERISGTKGSVSEKEMKAFEQAGPNIANTPQGNVIVAKLMEAQLQREYALNELEAEMLGEGKTIFEARKARSAKRKELMLQPVLSDEEINVLMGASGSSQTPDEPALKDALKRYPSNG